MDAKTINELLEKQECVEVRTPISKAKGKLAGGSLNLQTANSKLALEVFVPVNFPLKSLLFTLENPGNHRHLLRNGWICFESPFCPDPEEKLQLDLAALLEWVETYYEQAHSADHYEYLELPRQTYFMLFDERKETVRLEPGEMGEFTYSPLNGPWSLVTERQMTGMAYHLGRRVAKWSSHYVGATLLDLHEKQKLPDRGLWVYLGQEPMTAEGKQLETWREVVELAGPMLTQLFEEAELVPQFFENHFGLVPIMLGYPLPSGKEVHWEMVLKRISGQCMDKHYPELAHLKSHGELVWGSTVNMNYERFFGRGKLHGAFTDKKILIIGLGALGSSLANALTRGGAKQLTIADYDRVEMGNVCRSQYTFSNVHRPKVDSLLGHLVAISPFVEVRTVPMKIQPLLRHKREFSELKKILAEFDLIFDCTASDALAWMLDQMKLETEVVNLSVTDEAKHLLCISERHEVLALKQRALAEVDAYGGPTFYEGEGCHSPTFRASFPDLNMLLNQAIAHLNWMSEQEKTWYSFRLDVVKSPSGLSVKRTDL